MAAAEAGGITQGIGAYKVQVPYDGKTQTCVFLDTPGHEVRTSLAYDILLHVLDWYVCLWIGLEWISNPVGWI